MLQPRLADWICRRRGKEPRQGGFCLGFNGLGLRVLEFRVQGFGVLGFSVWGSVV